MAYKYYKSHFSDAVLKFLPNTESQAWTLLGEPTTEEEFKTNLQLIKGEDSDGNAIIMDPSEWPSNLTWANVKAQHDANLAGDAIRILRVLRNDKLAESDWMANSDVTMTDAWKTYRQELRDLPATTKDPSNPTWPTEPT
tara:strand:+ start:146 stop:565 length:420 start_codon:yes stop_codon:yes gene_type:complete